MPAYLVTAATCLSLPFVYLRSMSLMLQLSGTEAGV